MPAKSKAQQKFMGIVHAVQKGDAKASDYSKEIGDAVKSMKKKDVKDFADTDRKGLPNKVENILRDVIKQEIKLRNEDNIKFSKEEMAQLHKDGQIEKDGHTYVYEDNS